MNYNIIGYIGCVFLFCSFIPQTLHIINTNNYNAINYYFLFFIINTSIFMIIYSYLINNTPILIANIGVMANNLFILFIKIKKSYYYNEIININETNL